MAVYFHHNHYVRDSQAAAATGVSREVVRQFRKLLGLRQSSKNYRDDDLGNDPTNIFEETIWRRPADYVEKRCPRFHARAQQVIYARAAALRARKKQHFNDRANQYYQQPLSLRPIDLRDTGVLIATKEVIE